MRRSIPLASLLILAAAAIGTVAAQDSTPKSSSSNPPAQHDMSHMNTGDMNMSGMSGMHEMPATVLDVDHKSGIVEVNSENMKLKVHFPPSTVADLKKGDQIKLHLGFTKG